MSNNKKVNLNYLPVFAAIVETGSITAAAHVLGTEKTRVSRILSDLEDTLETKLFYRTTRHLRITELGSELYLKCKKSLVALEEATQHIPQQEGNVSGQIVITAAHGITSALLPEIIREFSTQHPLVSFNIILTQESLNLVKEGIDVALRVGALEDSSYKVRKITEADFCFVATPNFLKTAVVKDGIKNLESLKTITFPHHGTGFLNLTRGAEKVRVKLKSSLTCNSPDMILDLALKGLGLGIVPEFICRDLLDRGHLVKSFESWKVSPVQLSVLSHSTHRKNSAVAFFIESLITSIKKQLGGRH